MKEHLLEQLVQEVQIPLQQVQAVLDLLEAGNTIPFIARYRKEVTGALDEVQIHTIEQRHHYLTQLAQRKEEVTRLIGEQDKLTEELQHQIVKATTLQQVEDIYRPFKQKRRTKAMIAIENGLEPLAEWLLEGGDLPLQEYALDFINEQVPTADDALAGAHEILAQRVSDNAVYREFIRKYARYNAEIQSIVKDETLDTNHVYQMYYNHSEKLATLAAHRTLAMNRAEKEGVLTIKLIMDEGPILNYLTKRFVTVELPEQKRHLVERAIEDGYKRFIEPAIERELRNEATERADQQAIQVFGENLRNLLLTPPLKGKIVLGLDPAYRTGCKLAVINETGRVLAKGVIYPHKPASEAKRKAAFNELCNLIEQYHVDIIAIGNGTASRESEQFVSQVIKQLERKVQFLVVNEAGASVYSASELAREEFPDFQVEERSAVSIARRLQDPLAELIKIDPKSMGVGQYQHDVAQKMLAEELDFVVNTTVNQVGVDVNTASVSLLQHVSGLNATTAKNVIQLRDELGRFKSREQIKNVKRLGPKTFEQAVGFLRIVGGDNPLDQTGIHPESYGTARAILQAADVQLETIGSDGAIEKLNTLKVQQVAEQLAVGLDTIKDIVEGLKHPLRDIRDAQPTPILREDVMSMEDLEVGMQLQGVVRNVVDFGAFVDIGVKQDGLIHLSKLSKKFIKHPSEAVAVGDIVEVEVIQLDYDKGRIGLKRLLDKK